MQNTSVHIKRTHLLPNIMINHNYLPNMGAYGYSTTCSSLPLLL